MLAKRKVIMRYKLMVQDKVEIEVGGQRKKTKREIDDWINRNIMACGLDWRVGYTIKFRNSIDVYVWRWVKNGETVGA